MRRGPLIALVVLGLLASAQPPAASANTRGVLTLQFGLSQLGLAGSGCSPAAHTVSLGRIVRRMEARSIAVGVHVVGPAAVAGAWGRIPPAER